MKAWIYGVAFIIAIAFVGFTYAKGHSAGYNKRQNELTDSLLEAQQLAADEYQRGYDEAAAVAEATVIVEEKIVEKIREVEVEIPTVVERIVEVTPECADLGLEYAGLLSNQVRAGNGIQVATDANEPAQ